ncbi:MAG: TAXI family TRAP transporter solute-binding subunit [Victivallales bacterium]|nr:TAXI family TRAP transporter solute-binding subunit [Victivallales bacterium]
MKKVFIIFIAALSALFVSSCNKSGGRVTRLRFVTGGEAGTYYAFGSVIAQHATNNIGIQVIGLAGKGSQGNILDLQDKVAELAFCQSDVMTYAYNGTNLFKNAGKIDCFSTLGALYREQVQIVTTNPAIKTIADLKGKVVSIGASGSGVYFNALDILGAYGLTENDITPTYQSFGDSADALRDGKIDAAFIVAGAPTNAVTDLSTTKKVYLVSLDEEHVNALIAKSQFYSSDIIKKETYKLDEDVVTVSVSAVIIVRNDIPADVVRRLCEDIYDDAPNLVSSHAKYAEVSIKFGASVKSVPYHPGAADYFKARITTDANE